MCSLDFFFFFQAEDGIRDVAVTGVQTCALPISARTSGLLIPPKKWTPSKPRLRFPPRASSTLSAASISPLCVDFRRLSDHLKRSARRRLSNSQASHSHASQNEGSHPGERSCSCSVLQIGAMKCLFREAIIATIFVNREPFRINTYRRAAGVPRLT